MSDAALFAHGRICGIENGPPETVFEGTAGVRRMYELATRLYEDGTPKTKRPSISGRRSPRTSSSPVGVDQT